MKFKNKSLWGRPPMKSSYDAVIIGGGIHGLATAYYLAKDHGLTDVGIIERRYVGYGGTGRNTAIVRANQRSQENVRLYYEGLQLWPSLISELDFNLMFFNCGNLNLAHGEAAMSALRLQVSTAQFHGVISELVDAKQCKELVPYLDISDRPAYPIMGGMFHPPGGTIRHDAAAWGLARGASARGVRIHQETEALGIGVENGRVVSVETDQGTIKTPRVLIAAGGYSVLVAGLIGLRLPIDVLTIQAMVSQPVKPFLNHVVSSGAYHVYCNQSLKGELVTGAHMDPWPNYTTLVTAQYIKHQAEGLTELMPAFRGLRFMRVWSGLADMTPDMAPIIDGNDPVEGLYIDCGWGYFGFKSGPVTGRYMARFMAEGRCPDILEPFTMRRFNETRFLGEIASPVYYGPWN
ncbi:MAG: FAD-dependent oxidoreductase [Proteobacteria bacterium]|nr:FAD-dependent oxidoreductase [Pseudomonadota bacterium]